MSRYVIRKLLEDAVTGPYACCQKSYGTNLWLCELSVSEKYPVRLSVVLYSSNLRKGLGYTNDHITFNS